MKWRWIVERQWLVKRRRILERQWGSGKVPMTTIPVSP